MSKHRRGRITVQHQPTGAQRGMVRMMGVVHAIFGAVFVIAALTVILPNAGLFALPFLAGGAFFCVNGIRLAIGKNDFAHRVAYDVETDVEGETIVGVMDEPEEKAAPTQSTQADYSADYSANAKQRLEQLQQLKDAGLITEREYREKRAEIIDSL